MAVLMDMAVVAAVAVAGLALLQIVGPCVGGCGRREAKCCSISALNFAGKWSRMSVCLGPVGWVVVVVVDGGTALALVLSGSSRW